MINNSLKKHEENKKIGLVLIISLFFLWALLFQRQQNFSIYLYLPFTGKSAARRSRLTNKASAYTFTGQNSLTG